MLQPTAENSVPRDLPEVVYTPDSQARHPWHLLRAIGRDIVRGRELAWRLFVRDFSASYRQTYLGYVWAFLPPLATTALWVFLNRAKVVRFDLPTDLPYPVFVLTGTLLWQVFVDALHCPMKSIAGARAMLTKISFPREALIVAGLGTILFNLVLRSILIVPVLLFFRVPLSAMAVLVPFGVTMLLALGLAIGLFLSPLGLLYQDVSKALSLVTQFWFYLTPVIYAPSEGDLGSLLGWLNPVTALLVSTRAWLFGQEPALLGGFLLWSGLALVGLVLGLVVLRLAMSIMIERLGS